jgi:hypothetical protein
MLWRTNITEIAHADESAVASTEALLITGPDGTAYAVPVAALGPWRLTADVATQFREQHEVAGHIIIVGGYQALGVHPTNRFAGSYLSPSALGAVKHPSDQFITQDPVRQR